jgi:cell division protein FtsA
MALRTPTKDAEDIKQRYGCALRQLADPRQMVEVPGIGERGPRQLSRQTLAEVIEPRTEELYSLVQSDLRRSGYEDLLSSGIVITGGSSSMQGMVELGEEIFHMPVRIGQPQYHGGLSEVVRNPRYSTAVGLLLLGLQQQRQQQLAQANIGSLQGLIERMKSWFRGNF